MQADINGSQRKILTASVRPVKAVHGTEGIPVRDGHTLPFTVTRGWSAPAGYYSEQWFLVKPDSGEVMFEGPAVTRLVWGLQSRSEFVDTIDTPTPLEPGRYQVVFALDRLRGGDLDVTAVEAPAEEAA